MVKLVFSRSFWLLACALAVAGFVIYGWQWQAPRPADLPESPPPRAQYYLRDAVVDVMDDDGKLSYRMHASQLLRYSDHSAELTDVQIESLGGERGVWRLQAGQALISDDQELMTLSGGVHMQTHGRQGTTRLNTKTLNVELKNKRLNTTDSVSIVGPSFETRAVGMQTAFENRDMILLSNVRTRYVP